MQPGPDLVGAIRAALAFVAHHQRPSGDNAGDTGQA
ncbi:hypothetical protein MKAN_07925 [Mycobacterium kansasii ATCC 12478]|uniref:Uncharacterized protein n=1 Tax=Mycobacterium kansasii ATCC 12478 TaxID=557599 RepID=U5WY24_MYCKA|nr:hypothetical protein MKAN_07925 [Mycobacterium kansasii ATCC 12478]